MNNFVFDVETFRFKAWFFEVVDGLDEAFVAGCIGSKWKVLFASDYFGGVTSAGGGFKLSGYAGNCVVMVLNEGFEWDWWLLCSLEFCFLCF